MYPPARPVARSFFHSGLVAHQAAASHRPRLDFFRCMKCNCCLGMRLSGHKCREKGLETNCPIWRDFLFTSSAAVRVVTSCIQLAFSCIVGLFSMDNTVLIPDARGCTLACMMRFWLVKSFQRNTAIWVRIFFAMIVKEKGDLNFIGKIWCLFHILSHASVSQKGVRGNNTPAGQPTLRPPRPDILFFSKCYSVVREMDEFIWMIMPDFVLQIFRIQIHIFNQRS